MGIPAQQLHNHFFLVATAFATTTPWLPGRAGADAITPATAAGGATPGIAYAASFGSNSAMAAEASLFIAGLLLVTALCFGWLVYLMITAPAEAEQDQPSGVAPAQSHHSFGETIRARIGSLIGHAGPV